MSEDGMDRTDYGKYSDGAVGLGRPEATCNCEYCENCTLPTYEPDLGCVWCRSGQHHHSDTETER